MVCLVCSVSSFPFLILEILFFSFKVSDETIFPFRKDPEKLKVFYLLHAFIFLRASERETLLFVIYVHVCVCLLSFTGEKEYFSISLLTSLIVHVLTYCLIFKLSWKSQQPLVGKMSWENFKCIYNFYLPSLPVIKCWPLQVGLTIFQRSSEYYLKEKINKIKYFNLCCYMALNKWITGIFKWAIY